MIDLAELLRRIPPHCCLLCISFHDCKKKPEEIVYPHFCACWRHSEDVQMEFEEAHDD